MKPLDELWMFPPRFYVEKPDRITTSATCLR